MYYHHGIVILASRWLNVIYQHVICNQTGECGIPAALVQRYADELQVELALSACAMEEVRTQLLQSTHMPVVNTLL